MKSIASSPGKIILFGEHFVVYGLKAILCAIDKRVTVTSELIDGKEIQIKSNIGNLSLKPKTPLEKIDSPLKPFYYLADYFLDRFNSDSGMKITVDSQIPMGVGLGSSSACCVAGAGSISGLFEIMSKQQVLDMAINAEKTIFQNTSGADCTVCTHGGIMIYDKENGFSPISSEPDFQLVIANSKTEHNTDQIVSNVKKFKEKNESEFLELCKKEEILICNALEHLKNNDIVSLGRTISENQKYLERIGVSNELLEKMIQTANKTSFGSKITGAGGGGCIFALTNKNNLEKTIEDLSNNQYDCFPVKIDYIGLDTF